MSLEDRFDATFAASMALREKQIQQNFRPYIGVHKWFARRPGTLFRNLLLSEFVRDDSPMSEAYFRAHRFHGTIADPFMGGGTPLLEANRLGFDVVGADVNPMAWWIVRQELAPLDDKVLASTAAEVANEVERRVGHLYRTRCVECGGDADVKYFVWVKTQECPACGTENDLFPGYRLAEAERHPRHVLVCPDRSCGALSEHERAPLKTEPAECPECGAAVHKEGPAGRGNLGCRGCGHRFRYPAPNGEFPNGPPEHRMWAIEYHCARCKVDRLDRKGRFFKAPDKVDLRHVDEATTMLAEFELMGTLEIPDEEIPNGDELGRLKRWGYRRWRDLFGARQLLGLALLLTRIRRVEDNEVRRALLTVFSDFLRYQNMLCRYDTYALKCQDIFAVHGFPVGLVQCENSLLGVPGVGAGAFRHFVEKYRRAKAYCREPSEKRREGKKNVPVAVVGERIEAVPVAEFPHPRPDAEGERQDSEIFRGASRALLRCTPSAQVPLKPESLDGVFTDPPYFDNVQYAELMDFCYVWLRRALAHEFEEFRPHSTQSSGDLTGNKTLGRGLEHFAEGLSEVFSAYARALKPGAPFVFTYHHNNPEAYAL
jgi:adenine-specific DNA methylase